MQPVPEGFEQQFAQLLRRGIPQIPRAFDAAEVHAPSVRHALKRIEAASGALMHNKFFDAEYFRKYIPDEPAIRHGRPPVMAVTGSGHEMTRTGSSMSRRGSTACFQLAGMPMPTVRK